MNRLVTIKTSNIPGELAVAKSYLESYDLYCYLKDELINQVHPYAVGGIKLQVREEDLAKAVQLLIDGGFAKKEDYEVPQSTMKLVKIYEKVTSFFKRKE